ncbi:exo-alpha-sialidase [bacterium]|nr:exo-alpha-sialidase [candidate division CSSED10-310 bacterium]
MRIVVFSLFFSFAIGLSAGAVWLPQDIKVVDAAGDDEAQFDGVIKHIGSDDVVVMWTDNRFYDNRVLCARSHDGGVTYGTNYELEPVSIGTSCHNPDLALAPLLGRLYAVYMKKTPGESYHHVYCIHSDDQGSTWQNSILVDNAPDSAGRIYPAIVVNPVDNSIHVTWVDNRDGSSDIYYSRSTDGGDTFSNDVRLHPWSSMTYFNDQPAITVGPGNTIHVSFESNVSGLSKIYTVTSDTNGATFGTPVMVAPPGSFYQSGADLTSIGMFLHVAWSESNGTYENIRCATSTDGGDTFSAPVQVSSYGASYQFSPSLGVDFFGDVYIAWNDNRFGSPAVMGTISLDHGQSFFAEHKLSHAPSDKDCMNPKIDVHALKRRINLVWTDTREDQIYPDIFANVRLPHLHDDFTDNTFSNWSIAHGVQQSNAVSVDGDGYSCRLGTTGPALVTGVLSEEFNLQQQGSLDCWFYDGYSSNPVYEIEDFSIRLTYDDGSKAGVVRALGVVNASSTTYYQSYDGTGWQVITDFERSEGWHRVLIEVDEAGIRMELDPAVYPSAQPVYEDSEFDRFESIEFIGGSEDGPYYLDSVAIFSIAVEEPPVPAIGGLGLVVTILIMGWTFHRRRH